MEPIAFTLVAIALYFSADWLLQRIEMALGRRLEHRSLVFFAILLASALATFPLLERLGGAQDTGPAIDLDLGQGDPGYADR